MSDEILRCTWVPIAPIGKERWWGGPPAVAQTPADADEKMLKNQKKTEKRILISDMSPLSLFGLSSKSIPG